MLRDLTLALRSLLKRPAFASAAVGTLAVGVAATTAIFSTVNATLLRPLPFEPAEDVYAVSTPFADGRYSRGRLAGAYVAALNESAPSVASAAAVQTFEQVIFSDDGTARRALTHLVGQGFFDIFAMTMAAGRAPNASEHAATPANYEGGGAVISHRLWTEMFGRDPAAVGGVLRMSTGSIPIVGVAPSDFDIPRGTDVWVGFTTGPSGQAHNFEAYLRVNPGTTQQALEAELQATMVGLVEAFPAAATGRRFEVRPIVSTILGDVGQILTFVLVGAAVLLLVASVNVATLLLGRGVAQSKEAAVRVAMGAPRRTIVRGFLAEAIVLATAATLVGVPAAWLGVRALLGFGAADLPRLADVPFDGSVLTFSLGLLASVAVLTAVLPAVRLARPDIRGLLNEGGRGGTKARGSRRMLSALVVSEVALAIVLVAAGGWLVRSYTNLTRIDLGFEPDGRLVVAVNLAGTRWTQPPATIPGPDGRPILDPSKPPPDSPRTLLETLGERLGASPQIGSVGASTTLPLATDWDTGFYVAIPGEPYDPEQQEVALGRSVSADFFDAIGTRFLAGRDFESAESGPIAIVNEAFVRRYLPGRDPLTTSFASGFPVVNFNRPVQIIGVVEDIKYGTLQTEPGPVYYSRGVGSRALVVIETTAEEPAELIPWIRSELAALDPTIEASIAPLADNVSSHLLGHRIGLLLMSLFAAVSLLLAAVGIHGVVAHATEERARELATRVALGASASDIRALVMSQGRTLVLLGGALGVGAAYALGSLASSRLYGVTAEDPVVLGAAAAAVALFTLGAFFVPAVRASRRPAVEGLASD